MSVTFWPIFYFGSYWSGSGRTFFKRSVSVSHPWENDIPKLQLANTNMTATASSRTLSQYQQQQDRATTCHKNGCKKTLPVPMCTV